MNSNDTMVADVYTLSAGADGWVGVVAVRGREMTRGYPLPTRGAAWEDAHAIARTCGYDVNGAPMQTAHLSVCWYGYGCEDGDGMPLYHASVWSNDGTGRQLWSGGLWYSREDAIERAGRWADANDVYIV